MLRLLLIVCLALCAMAAQSQVPDFIALQKKNGATVKNFYAGWDISFTTTDGRSYKGPIEKIANDSLYLKAFQVNRLQTIWGTPFYDTVNVFIIPFHYRDIRSIEAGKAYQYNKLRWWVAKRIMIGAGGYLALNLINSLLGHGSLTERRNLRNLGIGAGIFGAALYVDQKSNPQRYRSKKYQVVYMKMQ